MPAEAVWLDETKSIILHTVTDPLEADEANACMLRICEMVASVDHPVDLIGDRTRRIGIVPGAIRMMRELIEPHVPANFRYFVLATPDYAIRHLYLSTKHVLPRLMGKVHCVTSMKDAHHLLEQLRQAEQESAAVKPPPVQTAGQRG